MWPTVNIRSGGTFYGLPVIVSSAVPLVDYAESPGDSPTPDPTTSIFLIDAQEVLLAQGPIVLDVSRNAAIQLDSAPVDSAQPLTSLWQEFLVGLKAEQYLNWRRAHDAGVIVLAGVAY